MENSIKKLILFFIAFLGYSFSPRIGITIWCFAIIMIWMFIGMISDTLINKK